jgi:Protein of unknown function (DUF1203)
LSREHETGRALRRAQIDAVEFQEIIMTFRITGLDPAPFVHLYGLSDADLARHGAKRYVVNESPGFPDRIEMRDAAIGEHMILVNHVYQPASSPYHGTHAIFVREGARERYEAVDAIPDVLARRLLSVRAFDATHMMIDADVVEGRDLQPLIARMFANEQVAYLQTHNARQGCYAGLIERA